MGRRVSACLLASVFVLSACAVETGEDFDDDVQEVVSGRCSGATAKKTAQVKVLTLNLRNSSDDWKRRFPLLADEIVRLDPDIIGLQEVELWKHEADVLNDLIEDRRHAKYKVYQKYKPGIRGWFTGEGIGIMSRWPIAEEHHEDLPEMRISLLARVKHPSGGFLDVLDTHLHQKGGVEADAIRLEEIKQTIDLADRNDDCYAAVLTGDFNTTEGKAAIKELKSAGFVDSFREVHGADTPKIGNTSPIRLADGAFDQDPRRRIDFVFGRSAGGRAVVPLDSIVAFRNHDAKGFYPTDHLGVMTTFSVGF